MGGEEVGCDCHSIEYRVTISRVRSSLIDHINIPPPQIFAKYYASAESAITWQNFWEDANGFQTAFVKFWGHVAKAFKDSPGVIGYDIINEPFVGNLYAHPMLVVPGHADLVHLQPLYQRIHAEIRKVDSAKSIVFEPFPAFDIMSESGFTEGPGGPEFNDRQVIIGVFDPWDRWRVRM